MRKKQKLSLLDKREFQFEGWKHESFQPSNCNRLNRTSFLRVRPLCQSPLVQAGAEDLLYIVGFQWDKTMQGVAAH